MNHYLFPVFLPAARRQLGRGRGRGQSVDQKVWSVRPVSERRDGGTQRTTHSQFRWRPRKFEQGARLIYEAGRGRHRSIAARVVYYTRARGIAGIHHTVFQSQRWTGSIC